jgi:hypothetical protein
VLPPSMMWGCWKSHHHSSSKQWDAGNAMYVRIFVLVTWRMPLPVSKMGACTVPKFNPGSTMYFNPSCLHNCPIARLAKVLYSDLGCQLAH